MRPLSTVYDDVADLYDLFDKPFESLIYKNMRKRALYNLQDCNILEIGVGTGKNLSYYHASNSVTGVDISKEMLKFAEKRSDSLDITPELHLISGELPFDPQSFDTVVSSFVIYLQDDPEPLVNEIHRVLQKGGRLILIEYQVPKNLFSIAVAKLLTKVTHPLYGLDFSKIRTLEIVLKKFALRKLQYYAGKWLYVAIFEKD